jgi:nucleotide-binding universal stress UspA family protein
MNSIPIPRQPDQAAAALDDRRRFLAVLDGSPQDEALLRYTAFWADATRPGAAPAAPLLGALAPAGQTPQGQALFAAVPDAVQRLQVTATERTAAAAVLRQAAEGGAAALTVGAGAERRLAGDLLRLAACSVWFVPGVAPPAVRRVLVPVDFSVRAADSLRVAATLARLSGAAECIALHVYFNDSLLTGAWGERAARQAAEKAFRRFLKPIDVTGVKVTPCLREAAGIPAAINAAAIECQADLIVLASRGRSKMAALLQPAVADQVMHLCKVPLLAVKHFGAARGFLSLLTERWRRPADTLRCN